VGSLVLLAALAPMGVLLLRRPDFHGAHGERVLALGAMAIVIATAVARARAKPRQVHLAVLAALAAHGYLLAATPWLDVLRDRYPETLVVFGATLLLGSAQAAGALGRVLRNDGVALAALGSLVALLRSLLVGAGLAGSALDGSATATLFLGAAAYGIGSVVRGSRSLGAASLLLLNLALFSLWWEQGVTDPAFYGVPPGLTLLLATEFARASLAPAALATLRACGFALLYGSLAVQVLRVEEPLHALVLFVVGLATVGLGLWRRRHDLVLAGSCAVVLDVVVYLARHGLERDLIGALLLVGAGATLFAVAAWVTRRRQRRAAVEA
jgi:hypothetical protein